MPKPMTDDAFLERAIINTLRDNAGMEVDPAFERAAAKLVRELDNLVRELRETGVHLPGDGTPEEKLDALVEQVAASAVRHGMTLVLSASVPTGKKMHYQRVLAQSAEKEEYGAALIAGCIGQVAQFGANMEGGGAKRD